MVLTSFALLILVIAPGGAGTYALVKSGNPLVEALALSYGGSTWMGSFVNLVGLAGLIASFFSIIYAYSRQIFALSRNRRARCSTCPKNSPGHGPIIRPPANGAAKKARLTVLQTPSGPFINVN